jgi:acyl carrier protein
MATSRVTVIKFFEDHFSRQLNQPFDEDTRIADVDGFDSLAMVDLSIELEDTFNVTLTLDSFKNAVYLKDIVDIVVARLEET